MTLSLTCNPLSWERELQAVIGGRLVAPMATDHPWSRSGRAPKNARSGKNSSACDVTKTTASGRALTPAPQPEEPRRSLNYRGQLEFGGHTE